MEGLLTKVEIGIVKALIKLVKGHRLDLLQIAYNVEKLKREEEREQRLVAVEDSVHKILTNEFKHVDARLDKLEQLFENSLEQNE